MKSEEAIAVCGALASEPRLALYRLLVRRGPEGFTPGELARRLRMPAPTLSFHLKTLMAAGLVASRRAGRHLYYSPNFTHMTTLIEFLSAKCCTLGAPDADESCRPACVPARR
jgi:DNA-binding transcriptional ArsR family regulator